MTYKMIQFVFDGKPEIEEIEGQPPVYKQNINVLVSTLDDKMTQWCPTSARIPMDQQVGNLNGVLSEISSQASLFVEQNFNN